MKSTFIAGLGKRIFILILLVVVFWQLVRFLWQFDISHKESLVLPSSEIPIIVTIYYEALCSDSRIFITNQLQKSYNKAPNLLEIQFVPYGKAKTIVHKDGSLTFECQHGSKECEANIYHACVNHIVKDPNIKLNIISCMIRNNELPQSAMEKCTNEYKVDSMPLIQKCFESPHGSELLKLHGEATEALRPKVSFIPTITLDGVQGNQALILKNLFKEICKISGKIGHVPPNCD